MSFRKLVKLVHEHGACVNAERADAWFREQPRGSGAREIQRRQARQACADCPVRTECLTVALTHEIESEMSWGTWGGVCARDRQEAIEYALNEGQSATPRASDLAEQLYSLAHPNGSEVTSTNQVVPDACRTVPVTDTCHDDLVHFSREYLAS